MERPFPNRRDLQWLSLLALFLLLVCVRALLVGLYSESLPYWDQWDGEGRRLVKPWLEHKLSWEELLLNPHNEHRLVWTRFLFLALLVVNGEQWDNLVVAYANTFVFAAIYVVLFAALSSGLRSIWQKWVLATALVTFAALPYAWENTLSGFQNQFYFLIGFAVVTLVLAANGADRTRTVLGTCALAVGSLFTMASGLIVAPLAAAVLGIRLWSGSLSRARGLVGVALLLVVALVGVALVPRMEQHAGLKADSILAWLSAFEMASSWPLSTSWLHVLLIWSPTLLYCIFRLDLRRVSSPLLLGLGLGAWTLAQAAAIAYSRGRGQGIASRYMDLLVIGAVVNVWFGLRTFEPWQGRLRSALLQRGASLASAAAIITALADRTPGDLDQVVARSDSNRRETESVRAFVADGDPIHLSGSIPYPNADQLANMLSDATLRRALPPTVRMGLDLGRPAGAPFIALGNARPFVSSCGAQQCAEATGSWRSEDLATTFDFIRLPFAYGETTDGFKVGVCSSARGSRCIPKPLTGRVLTSAALREPFHLEVVDASPSSWIAVGPAIEMNRLSVLSRSAKAWTRRVVPHRTGYRESEQAGWDTPCGEGGSDVWQLAPEGRIDAVLEVQKEGLLAGIETSIGTYFGAADGTLRVEVCAAGGRCSTSERRLRHAQDNAFIAMPLSSPLALRADEELKLRFSTDGASHPVAFWNCNAGPGSARVAGDPPLGGEGRTLRLRLQYVRPR